MFTNVFILPDSSYFCSMNKLERFEPILAGIQVDEHLKRLRSFISVVYLDIAIAAFLFEILGFIR